MRPNLIIEFKHISRLAAVPFVVNGEGESRLAAPFVAGGLVTYFE
jgi:hypothetical protein